MNKINILSNPEITEEEYDEAMFYAGEFDKFLAGEPNSFFEDPIPHEDSDALEEFKLFESYLDSLNGAAAEEALK